MLYNKTKIYINTNNKTLVEYKLKISKKLGVVYGGGREGLKWHRILVIFLWYHGIVTLYIINENFSTIVIIYLNSIEILKKRKKEKKANSINPVWTEAKDWKIW